MSAVLVAILHLGVTAARLCRPGGVRAVIAENLLLKQQLIVLRRGRQRAPNLTVGDRVLCGFGSLFLHPGRVRKVAIGVRPATFLAFHRASVRRKYRRLSSSSHRPRKPGPTGPSEALIQAIVELKLRNPRFGCPRIARIVSRTFGVDIDKNVVRRVLAKHYRPHGGGGPSWLSFIGHATDSLWSVDLFRCESIVLQSSGAPRARGGLLRRHYNFVRPHRALKFGQVTRTPAMHAGGASTPNCTGATSSRRPVFLGVFLWRSYVSHQLSGS